MHTSLQAVIIVVLTRNENETPADHKQGIPYFISKYLQYTSRRDPEVSEHQRSAELRYSQHPNIKQVVAPTPLEHHSQSLRSGTPSTDVGRSDLIVSRSTDGESSVVRTGYKSCPTFVSFVSFFHYSLGPPSFLFSTLAHVAGNITAGCRSQFGHISLGSVQNVVQSLQADYPIIREMMCLQNSSPSSISRFEFSDLVTIMEQLIFGAFNSDCNECTKAVFALYNQHIPGIDGTAYIENVCGTNFTANGTAVGMSRAALNVLFCNGASLFIPSKIAGTSLLPLSLSLLSMFLA
ncbi:hypothetical protein B0H10DRAFT_1950214 [Mycena sp. CBHHK59/15]|nr:hypothetical protein B0H10DRAFT_1950214 [Mycena sp. CBHHK59/15]